MKNKWLTVCHGTINSHNSYADAVFWAQGTHCTEERPHKEGDAYMLRRTLIVKAATWEKWQHIYS